MTTSPISSPAEPARARRRALITAVLSRRHERASDPRAPRPGAPRRAAAAPAAPSADAAGLTSPRPAIEAVPATDAVATPLRVFLMLGSLGPNAGLATALTATGRFVVVGASSDPVMGVDLAADAQADVVLVDRFLGLADGLAVARHLHRDAPRATIVLRTPWPDPDRHDAARAGAVSTVDVAASTDELAAVLLTAGARPAAQA